MGLSALSSRSTRGKTQPGRLKAVDAWLIREHRDALAGDGDADPVIMDVGVGYHPFTTEELAQAVVEAGLAARVVGVEIDPERVEAAQDSSVEVRLGGFDLPARAGEQIVLVRAFNVLRQYRPEHALQAILQMSGAMRPGGLLVDGSSDKGGAQLVARVHRQSSDGPRAVGLLFHSRFERGFAPRMFVDRLPRDLRSGRWAIEAVQHGIDRWHRAWSRARRNGQTSDAQAFAASAGALHAEGADFVADDWMVERGLAYWRFPVEGAGC